MQFKDLRIGDKLYSSDIHHNLLIAELVDKHPSIYSTDGNVIAYNYIICYNNKKVTNRFQNIDKDNSAEFVEGLGVSTWFASKDDYMRYIKKRKSLL